MEPLGEAPKEGHQTTHFSVLDDEGNALALTVSVNSGFGSGVFSELYGINLNNTMDDFTSHPNEPNQYGLVQGKANEVAPGKRPLSSMSPTLVEKNGKIILALGAPGGPRIISAVLQSLYRNIVNGYDIDKAIQFPRVHQQFLPEKVYMDEDKLPPAVVDSLTERGHKFEKGKLGRVYGVARSKSGHLEGAYDSRGEGAAGGY